jgi:hypothetical protein
MPSDNNILAPTGQDMLIVTLNAAVIRLMALDYKGTWESLKTVYDILPPKCLDDVQETYNEVAQAMIKIDGEDHTLLFENYEISLAKSDYLREKLHPLLRKITNSLFERGYSVFESNRPPTREKSMKDLELTINEHKYGKSKE